MLGYLSQLFSVVSYFDCDGVVLAEEAYNDAEEMVSTTQGTLKVFLRDEYGESYEDMLYDVENVLDLSREEFLFKIFKSKV